jgi:hypothetical protein
MGQETADLQFAPDALGQRFAGSDRSTQLLPVVLGRGVVAEQSEWESDVEDPGEYSEVQLARIP